MHDPYLGRNGARITEGVGKVVLETDGATYRTLKAWKHEQSVIIEPLALQATEEQLAGIGYHGVLPAPEDRVHPSAEIPLTDDPFIHIWARDHYFASKKLFSSNISDFHDYWDLKGNIDWLIAMLKEGEKRSVIYKDVSITEPLLMLKGGETLLVQEIDKIHCKHTASSLRSADGDYYVLKVSLGNQTGYIKTDYTPYDDKAYKSNWQIEASSRLAERRGRCGSSKIMAGMFGI